MSTAPSASPPICPLCGQPGQIAFGGESWLLKEGGRTFRYGRCDRCDLVFADPQPNAEELAWIYTERYDYSWFIKRRQLKRWQAWHRARRIRKLAEEVGLESGQKRILDVGCGHGWFVEAMQASGWSAEGLDLLSDDLVKSAAERGIKLHHGSPMAHPLAGREFDVVTMWHVLEHIPTPREAMQGVSKLLAPGGICIVAVPNLHSTAYAREGLRWAWCQKPFIHPWHHSEKTLRQLLPSDMDLVMMTSRDTWDAQYAESSAAWRGMMRGIYYAARAPHKAARMIGLKPVAKAMEEAQFLAEESLRLATYSGYLVTRPLLKRSYEDHLRGTELMMIARRKGTGTSPAAKD